MSIPRYLGCSDFLFVDPTIQRLPYGGKNMCTYIYIYVIKHVYIYDYVSIHMYTLYHICVYTCIICSQQNMSSWWKSSLGIQQNLQNSAFSSKIQRWMITHPRDDLHQNQMIPFVDQSTPPSITIFDIIFAGKMTIVPLEITCILVYYIYIYVSACTITMFVFIKSRNHNYQHCCLNHHCCG